MTEAVTEHAHWFSAFPCQLGPYGPQDVHIHHCIEGEPGDCYDAIVGLGPRACGGKGAPHEHMTLTEAGLQPAEALARLRATVPVAAIAEEPPRVWSFTRAQLIDALTHLEAYPATAGPGQRVFIMAESMADALIEALEGGGG